MSKHKLVIPGVSIDAYWDYHLNKVVKNVTIFDNSKYRDDYDWDYIYELLCDPKLNLLDQIKYSDQINMLRQELSDFHYNTKIPPNIINNTP